MPDTSTYIWGDRQGKDDGWNGQTNAQILSVQKTDRQSDRHAYVDRKSDIETANETNEHMHIWKERLTKGLADIQENKQTVEHALNRHPHRQVDIKTQKRANEIKNTDE